MQQPTITTKMLLPILKYPLICFGVMLLILIITVLFKYNNYKNCEYHNKTNHGFLRTFFDKGSKGEYYLYKQLDNFDGFKIILPNVYIPKDDGKTTEIDLIMITLKGIFIFENKNYSAWIFGKDSDYKWTYVLGNKKYRFYNPIKQNDNHIKYLKNYLNISNDSLLINIVNFGYETTLKKVTNNRNDVFITKTDTVLETVETLYKNQINMFTKNEVLTFLDILKDKYNVSEEVKKQHILNINKSAARV